MFALLMVFTTQSRIYFYFRLALILLSVLFPYESIFHISSDVKSVLDVTTVSIPEHTLKGHNTQHMKCMRQVTKSICTICWRYRITM